jgi:peptidyl-tRNA hydrolase, PTH1 family
MAYGKNHPSTTMVIMRLLVGIGNPGSQYDQTRHNCGFMALDALAKRHTLGPWSKRFQALTCDWSPVAQDKVLLLKPQTFVNQSGASMVAAMTFYKIVPSDVLVIVDDIHLPLGHMRLRPEGSAGGHNGLRDIEQSIGKNYARLRLGIGQPTATADQVNFVLGRFDQTEKADVTAMINKSVNCIVSWLEGGQAVACRFNGSLVAPPTPVKPAPIKPILPSAPPTP